MGDKNMEGKYQKFYELDIWKEGFELQKEIFTIAASFPESEKFSLFSQITRSSNSVIANIAEAHGRFHFSDKIRVLYIARGEIEETQNHILVAANRKYLAEARSLDIVQSYEKLKMGLNRYITRLNSQR